VAGGDGGAWSALTVIAMPVACLTKRGRMDAKRFDEVTEFLAMEAFLAAKFGLRF
jgi:hypothetical protein